MLNVYNKDQNHLVLVKDASIDLENTVWIDLISPSGEEEAHVEKYIPLNIPTREEMYEIEISNRLYREDGALFMTATVLSRADNEMPEALPVTFVLAGSKLITVRYSDLKAFNGFANKSQRLAAECGSSEEVLVSLIEAIMDRLADVLERVGYEVNAISREIFGEDYESQSNPARDFQKILRDIGKRGDLNSKAMESLVSLERLYAFLSHHFDSSSAISADLKSRVKTLAQDARALNDNVTFLSNKIYFLLDATLGMIGIDQNATIKIFSVAAVIFLPPTLIASIYGMNFHHMPELDWTFGYPMAIVMMVMAAIVPYLFFKRRGWL